jgi:hypothetical protein
VAPAQWAWQAWAAWVSRQPERRRSCLSPAFFDRLGLDILNQAPNTVAQPLLVALLTISLMASYLAYRGHRRLYAPALTLASGAAMYVSIYVWMSQPLYFVGLGGILAAGVWGIFLSRRQRPVVLMR